MRALAGHWYTLLVGKLARSPVAVLAAVCIAALAAGLVAAPGARASIPSPPNPPAPPRATAADQFTLTSVGPGLAPITGYLPDAGNPFDPITDPYPPVPPGAGWSTSENLFAGLIVGTEPDGTTVSVYCIDLTHDTTFGYAYRRGTWDEATVPNLGYIARILNTWYPEHSGVPPLGGLSDDEQAAAVQAAIWYFSDRFVLNSPDPAFEAAVKTVVADTIAAGPLDPPPPPSLTITPATSRVPAGSDAGPFTVTATAGGNPADAAVTATGASMVDAATGATIADGASVASGTRILLRPPPGSPPGAATLAATATVTVPTGNVFLYDGNEGPLTAQKLILAATDDVKSTTSAQAAFFAAGTLSVRKTFSGPAAGRHGPVTITVECGGTALPALTVPAGTTTPASKTYPGIPVPATCVADETEDGSSTAVAVHVTPATRQQASLPTNGATATITFDDDYTPAGSPTTTPPTSPPPATPVAPTTPLTPLAVTGTNGPTGWLVLTGLLLVLAGAGFLTWGRHHGGRRPQH